MVFFDPLLKTAKADNSLSEIGELLINIIVKQRFHAW